MDEVQSTDVSQVRWFALVSLVGHLGLIALGAAALWEVAHGGAVGAIAAVVFVLIYASLWRFWLAPGSRRRLGIRERWALTLVLVPVVATIAALGQLWLPAVIAGSFVLLGDALNQRSR